MATKGFNKGEEEYEHLLLDLERLNLGILVMEAERNMNPTWSWSARWLVLTLSWTSSATTGTMMRTQAS